MTRGICPRLLWGWNLTFGYSSFFQGLTQGVWMVQIIWRNCGKTKENPTRRGRVGRIWETVWPRLRPFRAYIPGRMTESITWITPFEVSMSAVVTLASFTFTPPSVMMVISPPCTVAAFMPLDRSVDITLPATT